MTRIFAMIVAALTLCAGIGSLAVGITWGMEQVTTHTETVDTSRDNTNIVWMSLRPDQVFYAEPDGSTNYLQVGFDPQGYMRWRVGTVRRKRKAGGDNPEQPEARSKAESLGTGLELDILGQLMLAAPVQDIALMVPPSPSGCAKLLGMAEGEYSTDKHFYRVLALLRRRWADAMLDHMVMSRRESERA